MTISTDPTAQRGNIADEIDALVRDFSPLLARICMRWSGSGPHIEDLVQEVFVTFLKKRESIDPQIPIKGWLVRTAINHARRYARDRTRKGESEFIEETFSDKVISLSESIDDQRLSERMWQVLKTLPEPQQEAFVLYHLEDWRGPEIAEHFGCPLQTVHSRVRLAKSNFLKAWQAATLDSNGAQT